MKWRVEGKALYVNDTPVWEFPFEIKESREVHGWIILILQPKRDVVFPDNAYGYHPLSGDRWQAEPYSYYKVSAPDVFFTGIATESPPGQVLLFTWVGVNVFLDVGTGKFIDKKDSK